MRTTDIISREEVSFGTLVDLTWISILQYIRHQLSYRKYMGRITSAVDAVSQTLTRSWTDYVFHPDSSKLIYYSDESIDICTDPLTTLRRLQKGVVRQAAH